MKKFFGVTLAVLFLLSLFASAVEAGKPKAGTTSTLSTGSSGKTTGTATKWKTDGQGNVTTNKANASGGTSTTQSKWKNDGKGDYSGTWEGSSQGASGGKTTSEGATQGKLKWDPEQKKWVNTTTSAGTWSSTGPAGKKASGTVEKTGQSEWKKTGQGAGTVNFKGGKIIKGEGPWGGKFSVTVAGTGTGNYKWVKNADGKWVLDWDGDGYGTYTVEYKDKNGKTQTFSKNFSGARSGATQVQMDDNTAGSVDDGM